LKSLLDSGAGDLGRRLLALVNDIKPEAPKLDRPRRQIGRHGAGGYVNVGRIEVYGKPVKR
jgi:hypothetical protein